MHAELCEARRDAMPASAAFRPAPGVAVSGGRMGRPASSWAAAQSPSSTSSRCDTSRCSVNRWLMAAPGAACGAAARTAARLPRRRRSGCSASETGVCCEAHSGGGLKMSVRRSSGAALATSVAGDALQVESCEAVVGV